MSLMTGTVNQCKSNEKQENEKENNQEENCTEILKSIKDYTCQWCFVEPPLKHSLIKLA